MKIAISTFGCDGGKSGLSQYTINILKEFALYSSASLEIEVLVYEDEKDIFIPKNSHLIPVCFSPKLRPPLKNILWIQTFFYFWCKKKKYHALFLPAANRRLPYFAPCPTIGTIHDFATLHIKKKYDPLRTFYLNQILPKLIQRLTKILTISSCSKKDIVKLTKITEQQITVIPEAVDSSVFFSKSKEESFMHLKAKYSLQQPFLLFVSRIEHPGKNHCRLIRAYSSLKDELALPHQLVFVGNDWGRANQVHEEAKQSKYASDILFTGFVSQEDLPHFYRAAELFVFPSLYEGFGLPILEAMSSGTPVICSNRGSLPEVAGNAAMFFNPEEENEIVFCLKQMVTQPELQNFYRNLGFERCKDFSWKETAKKTLDIILSTAL